MPGLDLTGSLWPAGLHFSGKRTKQTRISLASWNVRAMLDGESRPERRTALIDRELHHYGVSIAALQETRIEGQGKLREENYTFF